MARVKVVYKSGAVVNIRCKDFVVTKSGGEITEIKWDRPRPKPLHIGVNDIAAVYERKIIR